MADGLRATPDRSETDLQVGPYRVRDALGEGGFGHVYEALDTRSAERVAIKALTRASPSALARFKREFRALSDVHHPNLVELRSLLEEQGRWFIVMELVDGPDWLDWVRGVAGDRANDNAAGFDEDRLRRSLLEVTDGLTTLHAAGFVHRDLKPGNMKLTRDGRTVLLDFGLITGAASDAQSTHAAGIGTVAYMAPEQAAGQKVGPAADWYALGASLYEALTGRLPFGGETALAVMMAKQGKLPPPPSAVLAGSRVLPRDLEQLAMALLQPDPELRAGAARVRAACDPGGVCQSISLAPCAVQDDMDGLTCVMVGSVACPTSGVALAGRDAELRFLHKAFARSQDGELRVALVEGESGIGKSALVNEFARQLRLEHRDAVVLKGRCYENERVPYKAFDGCMDALTRALKRLPEDEVRALLPGRAALLAQLFPVLGDVPAVARAPLKGASADPTARKLEAFAALAQLLQKLALARPLLLLIDDLQWADAESFRLLRFLVESPDQAPMLIVFTTRGRDELTGEIADSVAAVRGLPCGASLELGGLSRAGARQLAAQLLGPAAPAEWVQRIAEEGRGHPLFIDALSQYTASHEVAASAHLTLEAALAAQVQELEPDARRLLELMAVAARPYPGQVFARALNAPLARALRPLLQAKLARKRPGAAEDILCFHDRVRAQVVQMTGVARLPVLHRALARALDQAQAGDPADLADHWEQAGEPQRASQAYAQAAQAAARAFAFLRAQDLYARALQLGQHLSPDEQRALRVERAHALAQAGKSRQAAALYQQAAADTDPQSEQNVRLRIHAAQHLIQSAQVEEGVTAARQVLADLGMNLPRGEKAALTSIAWQRARMRLRGFRVRQPDAPLDPRTRLQLEAAWQLATPLAWVDVLPSAALSAAHLRRALDSGDPAHAARALANEATMRAVQHPGDEKNYAPLLETSRELAERAGEPALDAYVSWVQAMVAVQHDISRASTYFGRAEAILRETRPGDPWLLTNIRATMASVLLAVQGQGQDPDLLRRVQGWLAEAHEREDTFSYTALHAAAGYLPALKDDEPEAAHQQLDAAMAHWPREPFSTSSLLELGAVVAIESYRGWSGLEAWFSREHERLRRAWLLKSPLGRLAHDAPRNAVALAAAARTSGPERAARLREARRLARPLRALRLPTAETMWQVAEAQALVLEGKPEAALVHATQVRQTLQAQGIMTQHGMAYLEGHLEGGEAGREKREAALAFFRDQGWQRPDRALGMVLPILPALEAPPVSVRPRSAPLLAERFEVLDELGVGTYGSVLRARDVKTGRSVALKELTLQSPRALFRFKQEFRALQGLRHPRLARLDALFESQGKWFIAMQHVPGTDLLSWTRPEGRPDLARVRQAFAGLAEGLAALHEAGFCHRDVKPENVRVTPDGKVVLLDFGFVLDLAAEDAALDEDGMIGTAAYMAPEQRPGQGDGPAADLYAMGVCLYRALCGALPFDARLPVQILMEKRKGVLPPAPSQRAPGADLPADLEALSLALLAPDPGARPSAARVRASLTGEVTSTGSLPARSLRPDAGLFSGRERELARLDAAFARTRRPQQPAESTPSSTPPRAGGQAGGGSARPSADPALVLVEGESGLGKTALVEHWVKRLKARHPDALVLRGRCFENEHLPYNALDGAVDQLARALRQRSPAQLAQVLPGQAAVLAELFPVLASVQAIGEAPRKGVLADPHARRRQGFDALRLLLSQLAAQAPLVLVLDDLQWADPESLRLLEALLPTDGAPPLMLAATVRPPAELAPDLAQALDGLLQRPTASRLRLGPLPDQAARQLVERLLKTAQPELAQRLLTQAQGHPLFLAELAEHARLRAGSGPLTLEAAIATRVRALEPLPRALLGLVALAGRPHGLQVYARALAEQSALNDQALDEALATLCAAQLLRLRRDQQLLCFHDRIRHIVAGAVPRTLRPAAHLALARALEAEPGADPAECARLWAEGGDAPRAAAAFEAAGRAALDTLAFERAAALFAQALEHTDPARPDDHHRLTVQRAHALARAGRSLDAAALYKAAAEHAQGEQQVRLRIWAAQHLIQSAQVEEGLAAARQVLADLGMALPQGTGPALRRIAWDRARIALRGLHLKPPPEGGVDPHTKLQLEAAWQLSAPIAWVEVLPSANLSAAHLRRALDSGDPAHAARALANEATMRALQRPEDTKAYAPLLETSRELAERVGEPALDAYVTWVEGIVAGLQNDFTRALPLLASAETTLREHCPDEPWLLTNVRISLGSAWLGAGQHRRLSEAHPRWLGEARERNDTFATTALTCQGGVLPYLLRDQPRAALAAVEASMAAWPREPFSSSSLGEFGSMMPVLLYRGGTHLLAWLERERGRLERAWLLKVPLFRYQLEMAWASGTLSAYLVAAEQDRPGLLRQARKRLSRVQGVRSPLAAAGAALLQAQLRVIDGQLEPALDAARRARQLLADLGIYQRHGAAYLEGTLEGGAAGRDKRQRALAFFRDQGWARPERALQATLPIVPLLE